MSTRSIMLYLILAACVMYGCTSDDDSFEARLTGDWSLTQYDRGGIIGGTERYPDSAPGASLRLQRDRTIIYTVLDTTKAQWTSFTGTYTATFVKGSIYGDGYEFTYFVSDSMYRPHFNGLTRLSGDTLEFFGSGLGLRYEFVRD